MDVLVLGSVLVKSGDHELEVVRPLERAMLVRLALAGGGAVSDGRLFADLWGDVEMPHPEHRLRVVVSRLRRTLGVHASVLARSPAGYRVDVRVPDLEHARAAADRMRAAIRTGGHAAVRAAASEALGLWRGPALADLQAFEYARAEGERLDGWRVDLTVARLRADLELDGAAEHVPELARLAGEHPLHEPISCLLALALYRSGRQADALERLARLRRALVEELGVSPGPEAADLEVRLLRQDPRLLASSVATVPVQRDSLAVTSGVEPGRAVEPDGSAVVVPAPATSFIGREEELAALVDRMAAPGVVTLVGEPGSGKSRLAVEAVRAVSASGRRCVVVELGRSGGEDVLLALAEAVGIEAGETVSIAGCARAVGGALVVMDNAEHVIEQVSEVVRDLRRAAAASTVLVTSQRPLLLAEEVQHRVPPLRPHAATTLFVERAAEHARAEPLRREDVATICAAVDNLPLGIELAAGLTLTLTVSQLARRVDDRLRLLIGGRRDASGRRHSSLRAALDWSHELLGEREKAVLRRVGVFAGGFDLEAAEQVVPDGEVEVGDVAPALADLVDRSLVVVQADVGVRRFVLLDTVRDYALAQLERCDELDATRARHVAWFMSWLWRSPPAPFVGQR